MNETITKITKMVPALVAANGREWMILLDAAEIEDLLANDSIGGC